MKASSKARLYLSIIAISFIQGLQYSVSPVLDDIHRHFSRINVNLVQMLLTAPGILSMAVALTSGFLVIKISKKKLLLAAALMASLAGLAPLLKDSFWLLFVSRLLFGFSIGIATTMNVAVVAEFFEGKERVDAMGVQAASVGTGIMIITSIAGMLGKKGFQYSYLINILGLVCLVVLQVCLPDTGTEKLKKGEKLHLSSKVLVLDLFGLLENLFLISFTTNIAMHLAGSLSGDSAAAGLLTGIFSGSQIIVGILLGQISNMTKKNTLPVAMISFSAGAVLLILFPEKVSILAVGAVLCGFSQGIFIPTANTEIANSVSPQSTAYAAATFTVSNNLGQLISPVLLNGIAGLVFGNRTTSGVYVVAAVGMLISGFLLMIWEHSKTFK